MNDDNWLGKHLRVNDFDKKRVDILDSHYRLAADSVIKFSIIYEEIKLFT